jgi:lactoylglutathione lyase
MLKLPDDPFVTLELVHRPDDDLPTDSTLSHLVIQVEDLRATIADLAEHGITTEDPTSPDDRADFLTCLLDDPDGNRIELVQWPPGHGDGMTEADLSED